MTEGTCSVAPRKPFATPVTPPTNPAIFHHVFLDLWTFKHAVEDRGAGIGWPLDLVRLCEEERSILDDEGCEDAGGGFGINVNMSGGWNWSGCSGRFMKNNGWGGGNTNGHVQLGRGLCGRCASSACMHVEIYVYCTETFVTLVEKNYVKTSFPMTLKRPCGISVKTHHDASRRAALPTKTCCVQCTVGSTNSA